MKIIEDIKSCPGPVKPELDTSGFPWDPRIHNSGRSKKKDGTWRLCCGVGKELVERIRKEYRVGLLPPKWE